MTHFFIYPYRLKSYSSPGIVLETQGCTDRQDPCFHGISCLVGNTGKCLQYSNEMLQLLQYRGCKEGDSNPNIRQDWRARLLGGPVSTEKEVGRKWGSKWEEGESGRAAHKQREQRCKDVSSYH